MADATLANFADFLREMKGPITVNYPKLTPLLDRIKRDYSRKRFSGNQVRVPIFLNLMPHAGLVPEQGTVNEPGPIDSTQAHIKLCRLVQPMSITAEVEHDSQTDDTSWKDVAGAYVQQATVALGRIQNFLLHGDGTALLASITLGATSATQTIGTTANFYSIREGMFVDVRTRSTGNLVTNGARRKILSVSESAGTVTLDVSITTTTNEGLYLEGSYGDPVGFQGLQAGLAQTGTFEDISRATYPQWKAVDGRAGDTAVVDLSEPLLDGAVRRTMQKSGEAPDFWLGDPAALDRFQQTHLPMQRWGGESRELDTGFTTVKYRTQDMFFDYDHKAKSVTGLSKGSLTMYSETSGPDWYDFPGGSMYAQFNRSFTKEAWLHDRAQLGFHRLNNLTFLNDLNPAA